MEDIQERYQGKLREKGYYNNSLLNISKLLEDIRNAFDSCILQELVGGDKNKENWLRKTIVSPDVPISLGRHFIVTKFLFKDLNCNSKLN